MCRRSCPRCPGDRRSFAPKNPRLASPEVRATDPATDQVSRSEPACALRHHEGSMLRRDRDHSWYSPQGKRAAESEPVQRFCAIEAPANCQINKKIGHIPMIAVPQNSAEKDECRILLFVPDRPGILQDAPSRHRKAGCRR